MNCERIETRLIAYGDGRASATERHEVETHLAGCGACRARSEEFRRLRDVLDELPLLEPAPDFDARLRARIAAEPPRPKRWAGLVPSPRVAFALSLLLLLSLWISSLPPANVSAPSASATSEAEFKMIRDLPVLEDYDVLANFEALSELSPQPASSDQEM